MDNQTNMTPFPQTPQPVINPEAPSPVKPSAFKKTLDVLIGFLKPIQENLTKVMDSLGAGSSSVTEISQRTKRLAISIAALFLTLVTLIIVLTYFKNRNKVTPQEEKKDGGAATTIVERKPSRYATDEAVLKIETDVKALESEIGKSEIEEKNLTPPSLNFDINFKE